MNASLETFDRIASVSRTVPQLFPEVFSRSSAAWWKAASISSPKLLSPKTSIEINGTGAKAGTTWFALLVGTNGETLKVVPLADHTAPVDAVTQSVVGDAAQRCTFSPAILDGVPTECLIVIGLETDGSSIFFDRAITSVVK